MDLVSQQKKTLEHRQSKVSPFRGGARWRFAWGLPIHPQCADGLRSGAAVMIWRCPAIWIEPKWMFYGGSSYEHG